MGHVVTKFKIRNTIHVQFFLKKIPTCNMNYTRTLACSMAANKTHSSWHRAMNQDAQTSKKAKVQHA